jgi:hypothetical protein
LKRSVVLHPFFLAAYSVLFLLSYNIDQISYTQAFRPLLIVLASAAILMLILGLAAKDWQQGGLSASLILVLFFSYGHVYRMLEKYFPSLASHIFLGVIWLGILLLGLFLKWKIRDVNALTRVLNLISFVLLIFPVYSIIAFQIQSGGPGDIERASPWEKAFTENMRPADDSLPDLYYIIADGYGRSDLLREMFEFDNSAFLQFLGERGFYVAKAGHSNYVQTSLSLASSLNFDYINYLTEVVGGENRSRDPLAELIQHSQIREFLEQQGYQTVAFATGYGPSTISDADIYIPYQPEIVNNLESMLLTSSAARALGSRMNNLFTAFSCDVQRGGIQNIFEHLEQVPELEGPQFVFAHIMSPHPPFVFGPNGEQAQHGDCNGLDGDGFQGSFDDYRKGYPQQAYYISTRLEETIDQILINSTTPPIIIIQADHGSGLLLSMNSMEDTCLRERTSILNAYYLPEGGDDALYESITPVNSFRVVLNHYFDTDLPLLEDRIYYSAWDQPYQFEDVTNKLEDKCEPIP